jgi:hypothetical protein
MAIAGNHHQSTKEVLNIDNLITEKSFLLPKSYANDRSIDTGKAIILVFINSKKFEVVVEEEIKIPYQVYCVLKDSAVYKDIDKYDLGAEFNPFYEGN